ncbi:MAG: beta-hydroxyacyl-ACP dehydratase [Verrucomicrobiota bacterium]|nr:beta-hydroxyacyl-ACP dehydratase [Verrucomicrobiota bacterium]
MQTTANFSQHLSALPHRAPFVFVQELRALEPGRSAECATTFAASDPIFAGHFPGNPLVPGVLLTEALAQCAGIAAASGYDENERPLFLLSAIRGMKFPRAARPNEQIELRAEKTGEMGGLFQFAVRARVGEATVAEGHLVLSLATPA